MSDTQALLNRVTGLRSQEEQPRQMTLPVRHVLEQGRILIQQLRQIPAEIAALQHLAGSMAEVGYLERWYQTTAAVAETALRSVQFLPETPAEQNRLSQALDAILQHTGRQIQSLRWTLSRLQREQTRLHELSQLLVTLAQGQSIERSRLDSLAQSLREEALEGTALRFLAPNPAEPARFVAAHGLNVAQVIARLTRHDPEYRRKPLEPILAALLHDIGMLRIPPAVLQQASLLAEEQRLIVDEHARIGGEILQRHLPSHRVLAEVAARHHERPVEGAALGSTIALTRLVAVCDVYAALCTPRPYRPERDPRTALTDTLELAEKGLLDRHQAERLLHLTFYPVGTVVELADGSLARVLAVHPGRINLVYLSRPIVAVLTSAEGQPLPEVAYVDLSEREGSAVVRALPLSERQTFIGTHFPELL